MIFHENRVKEEKTEKLKWQQNNDGFLDKKIAQKSRLRIFSFTPVFLAKRLTLSTCMLPTLQKSTPRRVCFLIEVSGAEFGPSTIVLECGNSALPHQALGKMGGMMDFFGAKTSFHEVLAVTFISIAKVITAPIAMVRPVSPSKKNETLNNTM